MLKDELKPIDVSKYRVTETGQVLKMTNEELAKKADSNHALLSQLADLEKENAELKKEVEKHKLNDIFLEESAFYDKKISEEYTTLQERIAELEKENAELKKLLREIYMEKMTEINIRNNLPLEVQDVIKEE